MGKAIFFDPDGTLTDPKVGITPMSMILQVPAAISKLSLSSSVSSGRPYRREVSNNLIADNLNVVNVIGHQSDTAARRCNDKCILPEFGLPGY